MRGMCGISLLVGLKSLPTQPEWAKRIILTELERIATFPAPEMRRIINTSFSFLTTEEWDCFLKVRPLVEGYLRDGDSGDLDLSARERSKAIEF